MVCTKSSLWEAGEGEEPVWHGSGERDRGMMLSSMTRSGLACERKLELIRGEQGDTTSSFCKLVSIAGGVLFDHGGRRRLHKIEPDHSPLMHVIVLNHDFPHTDLLTWPDSATLTTMASPTAPYFTLRMNTRGLSISATNIMGLSTTSPEARSQVHNPSPPCPASSPLLLWPIGQDQQQCQRLVSGSSSITGKPEQPLPHDPHHHLPQHLLRLLPGQACNALTLWTNKFHKLPRATTTFSLVWEATVFLILSKEDLTFIATLNCHFIYISPSLGNCLFHHHFHWTGEYWQICFGEEFGRKFAQPFWNLKYIEQVSLKDVLIFKH